MRRSRTRQQHQRREAIAPQPVTDRTRQDQDDKRDTAKAAGKPPSALPALESFAKLFALAGAVLYGTLFYAYGRYFDELDARPEDVGITYIFILTRSIGLALIVLILLGVWISIMRFVFSKWALHQGSTKPAVRYFRTSMAVAALATALGLGLWFSFHFRSVFLAVLLIIPMTLVAFFVWEVIYRVNARASKGRSASNKIKASANENGSVTANSGQTLLWSYRESKLVAGPWTIILGFVAVITPVALALGIKANDMAHDARYGDAVKPWKVKTFTMLDVQSTPAHVAWVGPKGEEPKVLSQAERGQGRTYRIRYLGTSGSRTLLLIVGDKQALPIRVPTAYVEINTCRGRELHSTDKECRSDYP